VERIREGVRRFSTEIFPQKQELYADLAERKEPEALLHHLELAGRMLTCGDSRINPALLTGSEPGEIFVGRTPGKIVPIYNEADRVGVSASIEYAVAVLGVQNIIICGHSARGAMDALLQSETLKAIPDG
jgi:carbonic anhydrase